MKQVMTEYAGAVIALLGALSFFLVFHTFFVGGEGVLGQMLTYSIGEKSIAEHEAFDAYKTQLPPIITEKDYYVVVANKRVSLSSCFEAKASNGDSLQVYLDRAWNMAGRETNIGVSEDRRSICVPAAGSYWIQIYAIDEKGIKSSQIVTLLVNER